MTIDSPSVFDVLRDRHAGVALAPMLAMELAAEVSRVRLHIAAAEAQAARRDVSSLARVQQILRRLLLRALAVYRDGGRFPINRDFAERTPYFIDASGTRCAMAHLLELGGERELVAKIAHDRNNAYVRELADEPRLLEWLVAAGLGVEEAAAIQPAYCDLPTDCICGGDFSPIDYPIPARGVLEGVVQANGMAIVEQTYGDSLGIAVGNQIALTNTFVAGTRILAPIDDAGVASFPAIALDDGAYNCTSQGVNDTPALAAADFARAVLASDCVGELHAIDSEWAEAPNCEDFPPGDDPPGFGDGGNCSAGAGDPTLAVGILLAVVSALARRR